MNRLPFITFILPVRNEALFIAHSLRGVLAQDYPPDRMEVIVTDGLSTDGTGEIVRRFEAQHPRLRVIANDGGIVPTGLNLALRQAAGDIIIRVDGHTIIAPDYARECVAALQRSGADHVGGRMDAVAEGRWGRAIALATSSPFGVGGARFHYSRREEWVDTVYLGAWPRAVFQRIGLFDEELVRDQDDEFNYRLLARGGQILLSPRIASRYYNRSSLRALWRQYFQYGYWKVRVLQKHPNQMRPRQGAPPLFVAALWLSLGIAPFSPAGYWMFAVVAGAYLVVNLGASTIAARREDYSLLPLLVVTFAALHLAYGLGFLLGLLRFWNRWGDREGRSSQAQAPAQGA